MENKSTSGDHQDTLQNILTEEEVLKLTGLTKSQLADCRTRKQLPFLRINQKSRLYLERDLVAWLKDQRMVLNTGE